MPRFSRHNAPASAALWSLPDGGEAQLRAAAQRDSQQVDEHASTVAQSQPPNVHALSQEFNFDAADVGVGAGGDGAAALGGDAPAADDALVDNGESPAADTEPDDVVLEGVEVEGGMAAEEDQRELAAAEAVVVEGEAEADAVAAAAAEAADDTDDESVPGDMLNGNVVLNANAAVLAPANAVALARAVRMVAARGKGGKGRGKGPKRHRKVLRDNIRTLPPLLVTAASLDALHCSHSRLA